MARIPPPPSQREVDSDSRVEEVMGGDGGDGDGGDDNDDAGAECGADCRNRLHELGHPREEERCGVGQVLDIWGYCRYLLTMPMST